MTNLPPSYYQTLSRRREPLAVMPRGYCVTTTPQVAQVTPRLLLVCGATGKHLSAGHRRLTIATGTADSDTSGAPCLPAPEEPACQERQEPGTPIARSGRRLGGHNDPPGFLTSGP